ncbi:MAG: SH3 domain-containing protein, partial [Treponema sp.]|nr:SH3 domain-containing protein [Treponema sp.]
VKKGKVSDVAQKYAEFANSYASVKLNGLPSRAEPVNTAKQVYRLRKGEVVKILYKGEGTAPMTGGKPLPGEWFKILMNDGTQGWCFSYNLALFQMDKNGEQIGGEIVETSEEVDTRFDELIKNSWYPDYYSTLISSGNIDLSRLSANYKFVIDLENEKVSLNMNKIHESWKYEGYTKTDDNEFTLTNVPIIVFYKRADYIVIRYTDESGKPQDINLVAISEDLSEIIAQEKERRNQVYMQLVQMSPELSSSNYGTLELKEDGTFKWSKYKLLVPSVIPAGVKNVGTATIKYTLSKPLQANYDGVITFNFDSSNGTTEEVNFLYKIEESGLRLEDTNGASIKGNQITSRGSSPTIVYLTK